MVNQELLRYIRQEYKRGFSKEKIKKELLMSGWSEEEVSAALISHWHPGHAIVADARIDKAAIASGKLPSVLTLLKESVAIYRNNLSLFTHIMLIPAVLGLLNAGFNNVLKNKGMEETIMVHFLVHGEVIQLFVITAAIMTFFFLAGLVIYPLGDLAIFYALKENDANISISDVYGKAFRSLTAYWKILLFSYILIIGGSVFFIVPGIIFWIWFSFAAFILVMEGTGGMNALLRSREYVRGRIWEVGWKVVFGLFFTGLLAAAGMLIVYLLSAIHIPYVSILTRLLRYFVILPLGFIYMYLVYTNLKLLRKDTTVQPNKKEKVTYMRVGIAGCTILAIALVLYGITAYDHLKKDMLYKWQMVQDTSEQKAKMLIVEQELQNYYIESSEYPLTLDEIMPNFQGSDPKLKPVYYGVTDDKKDYKLCVEYGLASKKCVTARDDLGQ